MIQVIGLIVAVYAFARLLQLPLSVPRGPAYHTDRIATWCISLAGAVLVGILALWLVGQSFSPLLRQQPTDHFLR